MTLFMSSAIAAFMIVVFLLWYFRGFSRELEQGKKVGLLVKPVVVEKADLTQRARKIIQMSARAKRPSGRSNVVNNISHKAVSLIAIALLAGSRGLR